MTREEICMTKEDILQLKPGQELDALVNEKVMGKKIMTVEEAVEKLLSNRVKIRNEDGIWIDDEHDLVFDKQEYERLFGYCYYVSDYKKWLIENSTIRYNPKPYSTNIYNAWEVIEKLQEINWNVNVGTANKWSRSAGLARSFDKYYAEVYGERIVLVYAPTAPEAICKVALLAVLNL